MEKESGTIDIISVEEVNRKDNETQEESAVIAIAQQNRWLLDSGAGVHLIGKQHLGPMATKTYKSSKTIRLNTANGKVDTQMNASV